MFSGRSPVTAVDHIQSTSEGATNTESVVKECLLGNFKIDTFHGELSFRTGELSQRTAYCSV